MNDVNSSKYKLNKADAEKIIIGACIAMGGALLTYLTQVIGQVDFGAYTPIVVALASILINAARKFLQGYSA